MKSNRRSFLQQLALAAGAAGLQRSIAAKASRFFKISLAEWSFHKALFGKKMDHLDFPMVARTNYGIDAIELVNQFFKDKARDRRYLQEFRKRGESEGVHTLLIMVDDEGSLGDPDPQKQKQAVQNHHKWVDAAKYIGCHSIRVNAETENKGTFEEQQKRAADGLRSLSEYGARQGLNVIVENHGGLSSNGQWLAGVMKLVNLPNCGTLPDFGNFTDYDRYKGVQELLPFAKGVSAKSHDFDAAGNEIHTDYRKMMTLVLASGYRGYVGIEYEGEKTPEAEGVRLTKELLEKVAAEFERL